MKKFYNPLLIFIFLAGVFLRLYNFQNRLIFGPEQAISLITSAANLEKFSLLGEYNLQRTTSTGLNLIHGPLFSYFLLPFILLFNFRVLPISYVFLVLNLLTGVALFIVTKKIFNRQVAIFSFFYFMFSALMISQSLFIWILNPLPLIGVFTLWFFSRLAKKRTEIIPVFWLGLLSGIGFSLHYPYLIFAGLVFSLCLLISQKRLAATLLFSAGFLTANLTRIIFDLRHDFYHLRVLWQFFLDVYYYKTVTAAVYDYHFLHLFPYFCLLLAFLSVGFYKIKKPLVLIPIFIYLYLNFQSPLFNLDKSIGMPPGITLKTLEIAADTIASDNPPSRFNVVTLWDFDTVARPLRYLLKYYHHLNAQPLENYAAVDAIYAFAPTSYDFNHPGVWELKTFAPYQVTKLTSPSPQYYLYKLSK